MSAVLQVASKPLTVFDPSNKQHRSHYAAFLRCRSWARCPVKFILNVDHDNLLKMIQAELTTYYLTQEFTESVDFGLDW